MSEHVEHQYQERGYLVIKGFLSPLEAQLFAQSFRERREEELSRTGSYNRDSQVPKAFSLYGHFDLMLNQVRPRIAQSIGIRALSAVSSYARIYEPGAELLPHDDRLPLEHSATICLSRDDVAWNLALIDLRGEQIEVTQEIGDALLYQGRLQHWRIGSYQGREQVQVFLHYYDAHSERPGMQRAISRLKAQRFKRRVRDFFGPVWPLVESGRRLLGSRALKL